MILQVKNFQRFQRCLKSTVSTSQANLLKLQNVQAVIGLEIHAQLLTKSKLFSCGPVHNDAASNSAVSNFDLGVPGTLPSLNKECVLKSLHAALLLHSEIQPICRFDRKHYFYPDMPLGYQITQNDYPVSRGGYFKYYVDEKDELGNFMCRQLRLKQIQLEMDSGKTIRADDKRLFIDLNRAGVGLIEIVTEPDIHSAIDAATFFDQLRLHLIHNNICAGELHRGNMRVDANISLRVDGQDYNRTEIKNINSIRTLQNAIQNEITRQTNIIAQGDIVQPVTLNLDEQGQIIVVREKGDALDYRFTPEPNLPRLRIEKSWILEAEQQVKRDVEYLQYIEKYGMKPSDALNLVKDDEKYAFVAATLPKMSLTADEYFYWLKELNFACDHIAVKFPPNFPGFAERYVELISALLNKRVTKLVFIDLLKRYLKNEISQPLEGIIEKESLSRLNINEAAFISIFDDVCKCNPAIIEKLQTSQGKPYQKAFNKLRNIIVTRCNKRVSIEDAEAAITNKLGSS